MQTDSKSAYLSIKKETVLHWSQIAHEIDSNWMKIKWSVFKEYKYLIETLLYGLKYIFEGERHIIDTLSEDFLLIFPKMNYRYILHLVNNFSAFVTDTVQRGHRWQRIGKNSAIKYACG